MEIESPIQHDDLALVEILKRPFADLPEFDGLEIAALKGEGFDWDLYLRFVLKKYRAEASKIRLKRLSYFDATRLLNGFWYAWMSENEPDKLL